LRASRGVGVVGRDGTEVYDRGVPDQRDGCAGADLSNGSQLAASRDCETESVEVKAVGKVVTWKLVKPMALAISFMAMVELPGFWLVGKSNISTTTDVPAAIETELPVTGCRVWVAGPLVMTLGD
jgi:hypothetical protein